MSWVERVIGNIQYIYAVVISEKFFMQKLLSEKYLLQSENKQIMRCYKSHS